MYTIASKTRAIYIRFIFCRFNDHNHTVYAKLETSIVKAKKERRSAKIYFFDNIFIQNLFFLVFLPLVVDIF